jgi:hypothetical protein
MKAIHSIQPGSGDSVGEACSHCLALTMLSILIIHTGWATEPEIKDFQLRPVISWEMSDQSMVPVMADSMDGPWVPALVPITEQAGMRYATFMNLHQQGFYKLQPGDYICEDFNNGIGDQFNCFFLRPQYESKVTWDCSQGRLHVTGGEYPAGEPPEFAMAFRDVRVSDFHASLEIHGWNEDLMSNHCIGFTARADRETIASYLGCVTLRAADHPGFAQGWIDTPSQGTIHSSWFPIDSSSKLLVVFMGIGSELNLKVYDLFDQETPLAEVSVEDTELTQGELALWFADYSNFKEGLDVTVDNFQATYIDP